MGALLGWPSATAALAGQQAGAKPLAILRPQTASIHHGPPRETGNIVGGAFARQIGKDGSEAWEKISTTRIDLLALTRDKREENWGTSVCITNRDGGTKRLAIPHALTAADKTVEIAGLLASLGVGVVPSKWARQQLVQFLTQDVPERITAVLQIGWHQSGLTSVFVLPDGTLVPSGFEGARPVLQTASLQVQHGLDASGTVAEWIEQIAKPLAHNSN